MAGGFEAGSGRLVGLFVNAEEFDPAGEAREDVANLDEGSGFGGGEVLAGCEEGNDEEGQGAEACPGGEGVGTPSVEEVLREEEKGDAKVDRGEGFEGWNGGGPLAPEDEGDEWVGEKVEHQEGCGRGEEEEEGVGEEDAADLLLRGRASEGNHRGIGEEGVEKEAAGLVVIERARVVAH